MNWGTTKKNTHGELWWLNNLDSPWEIEIQPMKSSQKSSLGHSGTDGVKLYTLLFLLPKQNIETRIVSVAIGLALCIALFLNWNQWVTGSFAGRIPIILAWAPHCTVGQQISLMVRVSFCYGLTTMFLVVKLAICVKQHVWCKNLPMVWHFEPTAVVFFGPSFGLTIRHQPRLQQATHDLPFFVGDGTWRWLLNRDEESVDVSMWH